MIHDDTISRFETAASGARLHDLAARFMTGDHPRLIAFGAFAKMFVVDTADIRPTDGG
jgi:hypothetical protein